MNTPIFHLNVSDKTTLLSNPIKYLYAPKFKYFNNKSTFQFVGKLFQVKILSVHLSVLPIFNGVPHGTVFSPPDSKINT